MEAVTLYDDRSPRFLIPRLSHVGDCILTAPIACALRAYFPQALIVWAIESPSDQLFQDHPAIDELVVLPRGWLKSPSTLAELRSRLRALELEFAIDAQSLTKSSIVARLAGTRRRFGLSRPHGREIAPLLNNRLVRATKTHVVDRSLQLLEPLGIVDPEVSFQFPNDPAADEQMQAFLRRAHLGCNYAVINPGAGWASRQWSARRFGTLARYLGQHHGLPSVVTWFGQQEKTWAEQIAARSGGHALLAPTTTLVQLRSLLGKAHLFVGCDTGPMHLAAAMGTSCVVLHGPTLPEVSGPYGPGHVTIQKYHQQGSARQRRLNNAAMMAIQVEDVCQACDQLLRSFHPASAAAA